MSTQLISAMASAPLTMSSREIAELTGKRHDNILADIRGMFEKLNVHSTEFSGQYKDSTGRLLSCFNLPKRETLILVSGYDVVMRAKIIDRWLELESAIALPAAPALPVIESSLVLDYQGIPIRFLIDRDGNWRAVYADVATALGYVNKEQQYSARNILKVEVKGKNKQLRHPLYGDLILAAGVPALLGRFARYQATSPDKFQAAKALQNWLAHVAAPLVAQPAHAGMLLAQQRATPTGPRALAYDPDHQQTARVLTLWHESLGESPYRAAEVLARAQGSLAEALAEVAQNRWYHTVPNAKKLGKWLSLRKGQPVEGLTIYSAQDRRRKIRLWSVQQVSA